MSKLFFRPKFQSFLFFINYNKEERIETSLHRETLSEILNRIPGGNNKIYSKIKKARPLINKQSIMKWKEPHILKIYEALGCLADNRLEESDDEAKVYSSSRKKFYNVKYDKAKNEIMSNDNVSFYVGALGYPSIAYLMKLGELPFNDKFANALKDIPWKDLNVKNKNDFSETVVEVDKLVEKRGVNMEEFHKFIKGTLSAVKKKALTFSLPKPRPPQGY